MKKEDIELGEVYFRNDGGKYLFRADETGNYEASSKIYIALEDSRLIRHGSFLHPLTERKATPDEVRWYEACEAAGKFVPRSDKFIEGEVYKSTESAVVFRAGPLINDGIRCRVNSRLRTYSKSWGEFGSWTPHLNNTSKPTAEELQWFEACERVDKFVPKDEVGHVEFRKDDYIVLLSTDEGMYVDTYIPHNHIYQLREDSTEGFRLHKDKLGRENGYNNLPSRYTLRMATYDEGIEYMRNGGPVPITNNETMEDHELKVGDEVIRDPYGWRWNEQDHFEGVPCSGAIIGIYPHSNLPYLIEWKSGKTYSYSKEHIKLNQVNNNNLKTEENVRNKGKAVQVRKNPVKVTRGDRPIGTTVRCGKIRPKLSTGHRRNKGYVIQS